MNRAEHIVNGLLEAEKVDFRKWLHRPLLCNPADYGFYRINPVDPDNAVSYVLRNDIGKDYGHYFELQVYAFDNALDPYWRIQMCYWGPTHADNDADPYMVSDTFLRYHINELKDAFNESIEYSLYTPGEKAVNALDRFNDYLTKLVEHYGDRITWH